MKFLNSSIAMCLAIAASSASANETLYMQMPATVAASAVIPETVRNQCSIEKTAGEQVLAALSDSGFSVHTVDSQAEAANNKFVQVAVVHVEGFGGGSWSGPKTLSIKVDLKQGESTLNSANFNRSSSGGVFGGFKGTCAILDRNAVTLGKDVAKWMARLPAFSPDKN